MMLPSSQHLTVDDSHKNRNKKKEKNRVPVSLKNSSSVHVRGRPATLQHHTTVQVKLKLVLYALLESPVCFGVAETPLCSEFPSLCLFVLGQKWWSNGKGSELGTAGNAQFVIEFKWEQRGAACREMAWMFVLALCKSVAETPLCSEFRLKWSSCKYIY
jgi:hypothetical protein